MSKPKVIAILGPTASGKTGLGIKLALVLNGEIVSADSRQVYRGLDVGTGKDLDEYEIDGRLIPHHLIDVAEPNEVFDLAQYQTKATTAINDIIVRGKVPIVVGGTGLYLQALVDNYQLTASAQPNQTLRQALVELSVTELLARIADLDPEVTASINDSDKKNQRRLIRYVEILEQGGSFSQKQNSPYEWLLIGLTWPKPVLESRIYQRIISRLSNHDMLDEVKRLHQQGVTWDRLVSFGLEYKYLSWHLQKKLTYDEMVEQLNIASRQFAKRQMSWYRRWAKQGQPILWLREYGDILAKVKEFIK
ncbi:MAG: tRNA (adenosine(37)-N6)-dimethylallyltransferase MiaA [bacterium]